MITSFGFKYGATPAHDLLFDVRDLPNPHRRYPTLDGRHEVVKRLVMTTQGDARVRHIVHHVKIWQHDWVEHHPCGCFAGVDPGDLGPVCGRCGGSGSLPAPLPKVSIGCTGGRHRSVVIATAAGLLLSSPVFHRDLPELVAPTPSVAARSPEWTPTPPGKDEVNGWYGKGGVE